MTVLVLLDHTVGSPFTMLTSHRLGRPTWDILNARSWRGDHDYCEYWTFENGDHLDQVIENNDQVWLQRALPWIDLEPRINDFLKLCVRFERPAMIRSLIWARLDEMKEIGKPENEREATEVALWEEVFVMACREGRLGLVRWSVEELSPPVHPGYDEALRLGHRDVVNYLRRETVQAWLHHEPIKILRFFDLDYPREYIALYPWQLLATDKR